MSPPPDDKKLSRRALLTFWRRPEEETRAPKAPPPPQAPVVPGPFETSRPWPVDRVPGPSLGRRLPLRPPGNMHEYLLREACTRCGHCIDACPADAIFRLDASWGDAEGTPAINPRKQPCVVCEGLQCTRVCPSGALQHIVNVPEIQMGTAAVDRGHCVTYSGQSCTACVTVCPVPEAIAVSAEGHPVVEEHRCIGCGLCVRACPTEPTSIEVVPRG